MPNVSINEWGEKDIETVTSTVLDMDCKLHSENDKPAVIVSLDNEIIKLEWWYHGVMHRDGDKPALISGEESGCIAREWWIHGERHRAANRPAVIMYEPHDDQIIREWWFNGKRHRVNDPAVIVNDGGYYTFARGCTDYTLAEYVKHENIAGTPYKVEYW